MSPSLSDRYRQCDWCQRIWLAGAACHCRDRFAFWGGVHQFAVDQHGLATCLVCLREWWSIGKPWCEHACGPAVDQGVGTEIKRALAAWGIKPCGACEIRAEILDKWGVDLCQARRADICEMLSRAAWDRWLPPFGVISVVDSAIRSAIEKTTKRET